MRAWVVGVNSKAEVARERRSAAEADRHDRVERTKDGRPGGGEIWRRRRGSQPNPTGAEAEPG